MNATRDDWVTRQQEYGNSARAVLMKGMPAPINQMIDIWHRRILRQTFERSANDGTRSCVDLGCGYGRLATEASACGLSPVVGIDFTPGFCKDFAAHHGPAVCGKLTALPFADAVFDDAYCVTALMYLSAEGAREALVELDRCVRPNARILVIEPAREFNAFVRFFARRKRTETLAQPGLSANDMTHGIVPSGWQLEATGGCPWMTWSLPLLIVSARWPRLFWPIANWILRRDSVVYRPRARRTPGIVMYRWIALRKSLTQERGVLE